jgi:cytochrome c oxidase cbb3-type subunit 2
MTRVWLIALGAFAIMASAMSLLVFIPQAMFNSVEAAEALPRYTARQARGRELYIANGCIYCHSQQVRDPAFTTDVDRGWGTRATVPADYVYDKPHLLGTMRTGPDLINVGQRLPSVEWHLLHLYDPRAVNEWSTMPRFTWFFEERDEGQLAPGEKAITLPPGRAPKGRIVVPTEDGLAIVDYLISLNRTYPVSDTNKVMKTIGGRGDHGGK